MSDKNKIVLDRLKKLIDTQTREEIALAIDCDTSMITKHYNNNREVTLDYVVKYAKYFGVSTDYLLGLTEAKTAYNPEFRAVSDYLSLSDEATENLEVICDNEHFGIVETEKYVFDADKYIEKMVKHSVFITPNVVANSFFESEHILDFFDSLASMIFINTIDVLELKEQLDNVENINKELGEAKYEHPNFSAAYVELRKLLKATKKIKNDARINDLDLFDILRKITKELIPYPEEMIKRVYELEREIVVNDKKEE